MQEAKALIEPIKSLFPSMAQWWLDAWELFEDLHDAKAQYILGPIMRAGYVQRYTVSNMSKDPKVVTPFRPAESQGLDFLAYGGEEADLAILLRKLTNHNGHLRSAGNFTIQQRRWLNGELNLDNRQLFPLVCGPTIKEGGGAVASIDRIFVGVEKPSGFEWACTIWSSDEGLVVPKPENQLAFFHSLRIKVRDDKKRAKGDSA